MARAICPVPDTETIVREAAHSGDWAIRAAAREDWAAACWWIADWYREHCYPNTADRWMESCRVFAGRLEPAEEEVTHE
jgi:hypothetical protein